MGKAIFLSDTKYVKRNSAVSTWRYITLIDSGLHPASCPVGTGGSFYEEKAAPV